MPNYLLGDEALLAYLVGRHDKAPSNDQAKFREWAKNVPAQSYHFASQMSVAWLYTGIERVVSPSKRESQRQAFDSKLAQFKDSLLAIDEPVLKQWAVLRASLPDATSPKPSTVTSEQAMEIATALAYGHTYVTRLTPDLQQLVADNPSLDIVDPWA